VEAERLVRESEERFRALVENSMDGFALLDAGGVVTYLGHPILGQENWESVGSKITDLIHPADREPTAERFRAILSTHGAVGMAEFRALHSDGSWRWVECTAKNALGVPHIQAVVVTYRDITSRKEAERERTEGEQRLRLALDAGRMGTWDWDMVSGRIQWSGHLRNVQGLTSGVFAGTEEAAQSRIHPDDREELAAAVRRAISGRIPFEREFRVLSPEGEARWILGQGQVFCDESTGTPVRMVGVTIDIHDRKQGEEASAKLAVIVSSSADAIISKDLDDIVQTWNRGAEQVYGYTAEEMIGRSIAVLVPEDRAGEELEIVERLRAGERIEKFATVRVRKDGKRIHISLTITPIRGSDGRIVGAAHVGRDITEERRFEEEIRQTQKLESLGVLAGGISHDFNNLLVGIMGNASLLLEMLPESYANRNLLGEILAASQKASDLTRQLLAYAGKGRLVTRRVNLAEPVREISTLLQASIPKKIDFRLEVPDRLPTVEADPVQIQQIIMNLVINGAEAIGPDIPGTVRVTAGVQDLDEGLLRANFAPGELPPGRYVCVQVHDTGCGMDEATKARIFDPFFTTKFTGRGLGLSAVLGIVRGHKGALKVYSAPGRGSTFKVFLPVVAGESAPAEPERGRRNLRGSGTVLVIDDEAIVRTVARSALEHFGYRVLVAEHGRAGVEVFAASSGEVRLVLLDFTMPVFDGEETLLHLRAIRGDIPVILSSGFNETEAVRRFAGKGLAGFLQKPYTAIQLAEKVHSVLRSAAGAGA
jgi:PAS domain S-box-containing protein